MMLSEALSQKSIKYHIVFSVWFDTFDLEKFLWKVLVLQKGIFLH